MKYMKSPCSDHFCRIQWIQWRFHQTWGFSPFQSFPRDFDPFSIHQSVCSLRVSAVAAKTETPRRSVAWQLWNPPGRGWSDLRFVNFSMDMYGLKIVLVWCHVANIVLFYGICMLLGFENILKCCFKWQIWCVFACLDGSDMDLVWF